MSLLVTIRIPFEIWKSLRELKNKSVPFFTANGLKILSSPNLTPVSAPTSQVPAFGSFVTFCENSFITEANKGKEGLDYLRMSRFPRFPQECPRLPKSLLKKPSLCTVPNIQNTLISGD